MFGSRRKSADSEIAVVAACVETMREIANYRPFEKLLREHSMEKVNVEVSNPNHYAGKEGYIEPIDIIWGVEFNFGSANKYVSRLGLKGGDNTPHRDLKAAIWYGYDLMARLIEEEDGDNVPTIIDFAEFDPSAYIKEVTSFYEATKRDLSLDYHRNIYYAMTMAAMHRQTAAYRKSVRIGMSERQYREFVFETLAAAYLLSKLKVSYSGKIKGAGKAVPVDMSLNIYKGAKSFEFTPELRAQTAAVIDQFDKQNLANLLLTWVELDDEDDDDTERMFGDPAPPLNKVREDLL